MGAESEQAVLHSIAFSLLSRFLGSSALAENLAQATTVYASTDSYPVASSFCLLPKSLCVRQNAFPYSFARIDNKWRLGTSMMPVSNARGGIVHLN